MCSALAIMLAIADCCEFRGHIVNWGKMVQYQQTFFYFSIKKATAPIFGYLLEFWVDFNEH